MQHTILWTLHTQSHSVFFVCMTVLIFSLIKIHTWLPLYFSGLQQGVISSAEPYGLPLNETLFPQYLKQFGYATHIVGKVRKKRTAVIFITSVLVTTQCVCVSNTDTVVVDEFQLTLWTNSEIFLSQSQNLTVNMITKREQLMMGMLTGSCHRLAGQRQDGWNCCCCCCCCWWWW